MPRANRSTTLR